MCILNANRNGTPHIKDILVVFFVEKVEIIQRLPLIISQEPICFHFKGLLGSGFFPNRQLALGVKIKTHLNI
jgi:hypothetical protein